MCLKRLLVISVGCLLFQSVLAARGNTTFEFLRNDASARAAALGGSFVSFSGDPDIIFYNPAGMATLSGRRFSVGFFKHLLDINSGYASIVTEIPDFGFVGGGIIYTNYGEFKRTGWEGQDLGTFSAGELALLAGYAGRLRPGLLYGANAKFIYSSIADSHSTAMAVDIGIHYVAVQNRLIVGASMSNLGTQLDPYIRTKEYLPLDFRVGISVFPEHLPAAIMINLHKLNERRDNFWEHLKPFSVGVEFTASPSVLLRFGYDNEKRQDLKLGHGAGLAGFSIGGGFTTELYSIDYAFNSFGSIGAVHRINVGFSL